MLDSSILEQCKEVFSKLEHPVVLRVARSQHSAQEELLSMLGGLASASELIRVEESAQESPVPRFEVVYQGHPNGISFRGVPGGHEFTSLVLAILNSDQKGKRPDDGVIRRIQNLRGPIRLKTYISLSCENCPEVVQALQLMATLHADFEHEMVDGAFAQDEIEALGIQGVPAVVVGDQLIHSGKSQLLGLLEKLESHFGTQVTRQSEVQLGKFDVVVIGGGPAGASAAIYSARKGLRTAIIAERFGGQLQETKGIENMISMQYTEGAKLAAQLNQHVSSYPIDIFEHRRVREIRNGSVKQVKLESGETLDASALIIATGAQWRELGIPGEKQHIGQGVAFCAHCDGPFFKGKKVAVVGGGNSGVEAAIDLAGLASDVVLLESGSTLKADGVLLEKLKSLPNTSVITQAKSTQVLGQDGKVIGLEYVDRVSNEVRTLNLDGIFVQIGLLPNSQFLRGIVELTSRGEVIIDEKGRTSTPGIYAAGDVTTVPFKQIVIAMGEGAKAALTAFEDRIVGRLKSDIAN